MAAQSVVIVTGASRGIGEATARYFADRGWAVVLAARSEDELTWIAAEIQRDGGTSLVVPTDVTVREEVRHLVSETLRVFGRVDALINNAGMGMVGTVATLDLDQFEYLLQLNVIAPVVALQAVVPTMRYQGGGVIVNVSSIAEDIKTPFVGAYGASKAALGYLTSAADVELAEANIAVVKVLPGRVETEFGESTPQAGAGLSLGQLFEKADVLEVVPPEEVAATIWKAVQTRENQRCMSAANALMCAAGRTTPGLANKFMHLAARRYVTPGGEPSLHTLKGDIRKLTLVGGLVGALGAAVTAALLLHRREA